jgi:hypothetical protein
VGVFRDFPGAAVNHDFRFQNSPLQNESFVVGRVTDPCTDI